MTKKSRGFRSGSRKKLKARRKATIPDYLKQIKIGERVKISPLPSSHKGMPHPKFKGKSGVVVGKRGKAYCIKFKDGSKEKEVISSPEHLKVQRKER